MSVNLVNLAYLTAAVLFILGLKLMAHPRTAARGNLYSAVGMLIAIVFTLWDKDILSFGLILAGILIGSAIGILLALRIKMTAMPQMVALLNGFGGGASTLVAGGELMRNLGDPSVVNTQFTVSVAASGLIGAVTFWGSLVAFDKLQEFLLPGNPIHFRGQQTLNVLLLIVSVAVGALIVIFPGTSLYWLLVLVASVLGILFVLPVGGADMPVVICLLNSYSGLAGCATGFVINNNALIISGALVGSSGIILADIMCRAMNRSLKNVLLGTLGPTEGSPTADAVYEGKIKSTTAEEVAMLFDAASRVVIIPGYGLAVSQAQHAVRELEQLLESRGVTVEYAIHPVAGRMPGHMNVLLAEADVPYDKLKEMDQINPTMSSADVALVIGANDVVNPIARTDPKSVIGGMPIIDADKAHSVVVVKRSLSPGFAGIPNPLFAAPNTLMFFADGKKAMMELIQAVKDSGE
jgi:NAD(P) transhydrogenase subunit beta